MSTVIAKNVQIGTSGTATDNFTIFQPATPDGTLRIGNGNTGITTSQVALTSAGNVGIGTSSPGATLDIKGLARSSIGTGTGAGGAGYAFYQFGTSATATENWHIGAEGDGSFRFYNQGFGAGLERARIASNGQMSTTTGTGSVMAAYDARAWVNFNGTGTVAIRASGNVSSITDNGTGDYTVNFTNAMPDANYGVASCLASDTNAAALIAGTAGGGATTKTTSAVRVTSRHSNAALTDYAEINYAIFR